MHHPRKSKGFRIYGSRYCSISPRLEGNEKRRGRNLVCQKGKTMNTAVGINAPNWVCIEAPNYAQSYASDHSEYRSKAHKKKVPDPEPRPQLIIVEPPSETRQEARDRAIERLRSQGYISQSEAIARFHRSRTTLNTATRNGLLPIAKVGGTAFYLPKEVSSYITHCRERGSEGREALR